MKSIVFAGDYGIRIMDVVYDDDGKPRLIEPEDKFWYNSMYSDNPPEDNCPVTMEMWDDFLAKSWSDGKDEDDWQRAKESYDNEE